MSIKGLDVSEFQGIVDWAQVKGAGYQFAMLRAGYGFRTPDQQFRRNAAECNRIGLPAGAYWFCYAQEGGGRMPGGDRPIPDGISYLLRY